MQHKVDVVVKKGPKTENRCKARTLPRSGWADTLYGPNSRLHLPNIRQIETICAPVRLCSPILLREGTFWGSFKNFCVSLKTKTFKKIALNKVVSDYVIKSTQ